MIHQGYAPPIEAELEDEPLDDDGEDDNEGHGWEDDEDDEDDEDEEDFDELDYETDDDLPF